MIKGNNEKIEKILLKQKERASSEASSDTQLPTGVSVEESERIEAERKNLESARDFQRIANEEHYKEKATLAEIENQTGKIDDLSITSPLSQARPQSNNQPKIKPSLSDILGGNQTSNKSHLSSLYQTKLKPAYHSNRRW